MDPGRVEMESSRDARSEKRALGQLRVGETLIIQLPLSPASEGPVTIKSVETSCGCMQVLGYPEVADEHAEVTLRYVALKEGPVSVRVIIEIETARPRYFEFAFTGAVVAGNRSHAIMIEAIAPELFVHRDARLPKGLLVSATEARQRVEQGATLVDLRSPAERGGRQAVHAMEIPLHELRSKPFFGTGSVVLLGPSILSGRTLEVITALRAKGKVPIYYVEGGVDAWAAAGGPVIIQSTGDSFVSSRSISPTELHAAADRGHYLLIDATGDDLASIYLPEAERLFSPMGEPLLSIGEALTRFRASKPGRVPVLVMKNASAQKEAAGVLRDPGLRFLEGGLEAYREFLAEQSQSLLARRDGRNRVQARQGAMTASFPRELLSSGCSSCPGRR